MISSDPDKIFDKNQQDSILQNSSVDQNNESDSEPDKNDKLVDIKLAKNLTNQKIISHIRIHQTVKNQREFPWMVFKHKHQFLKDHKYIESKIKKNKRFFNYKNTQYIPKFRIEKNAVKYYFKDDKLFFDNYPLEPEKVATVRLKIEENNQDEESESNPDENDKIVDLKLAKNLIDQRIISHIRIHQTVPNEPEFPWLVFNHRHQLLKDHKYIEAKIRNNRRYYNYKNTQYIPRFRIEKDVVKYYFKDDKLFFDNYPLETEEIATAQQKIKKKNQDEVIFKMGTTDVKNFVEDLQMNFGNLKDLTSPPLGKDTKTSILNADSLGISKASNAKLHNCSIRSIHNVIKKWVTKGTIARKKYTSEIRGKLTEQEKTNILYYYRLFPDQKFNQILNELNLPISKSTLCKFLKSQNYEFCATQLGKLYLEAEEKNERFQWADQKRNWTIEQWSKIVFTDKCTIQSISKDDKETVICSMEDQNQLPVSTDKSCKINIWGYISYNKCKICRINHNSTIDEFCMVLDTQDQTLNDIASVPCIQYFQQDNLPSHLNGKEVDLIDCPGLECMGWPMYSLDLNPIENIWAILKYKINKKSKQEEIGNDDKLWEVVKSCFSEISITTVQNLISNMPERVNSILYHGGEHIRSL